MTGPERPSEATTDGGTAERPVPLAPAGGPATPPRVGPLLTLYTLGRVAIAAALVAAIWLAGLAGFPALLFGLLLSMPVSYLLLRGLRDRLTEALAARGLERQAAKEQLRARLSGDPERSAHGDDGV